MVAAFDYCLFGTGGAAPSIDTAMHGLVDAPHVDHLHPDAGIAIATAADGEALTKEIFGDRVVWVPWRRPGFQLGLDIAAVQRANPQAIGVILGGHGITAWGATSAECEAQLAGDHPRRAAFIDRHGAAEPFGAVVHGFAPLPDGRAARPRGRAVPGGPGPRLHRPARRSATTPTPTSCSTSSPASSCPSWPRWARPARTTSCAPRSGRWCSTCRRRAAGRRRGPAARAARRLPRRLPRPTTSGTPPPDSPPMRGADPAIVLVPGVGMFSLRRQQADRAGGRRVLRQRDQRDARRRGGLDVRADRRGGEVPHRVLGPRGGQAAADAEAEAAGHPGRVRHRRRLGHRPGHRATGSPPRAPASWSPTATRDAAARGRRRDRFGRTWRSPVTADVTDADGGRRRARGRPCWRSAASTWWSTTPGCPSPSRCWRPPRRTGTCSTT